MRRAKDLAASLAPDFTSQSSRSDVAPRLLLDGIYSNVHLEEDRPCILVVMGLSASTRNSGSGLPPAPHRFTGPTSARRPARDDDRGSDRQGLHEERGFTAQQSDEAAK